MKVVCEGINLSEAVLKVVKACAVRTTVPLLECIKLTAHNARYGNRFNAVRDNEHVVVQGIFFAVGFQRHGAHGDVLKSVFRHV